VVEIAAHILGYSDDFYLERAKHLHERLSYMTTDYVIENYLVPASMAIKASG
jgi:hypothetical protein